MFAWLFRKKSAAEPSSLLNWAAEMERRLAAQEARSAALAEALQEEQAKAFAFRGRVYAYLGKKGVKLSHEDGEPPSQPSFDWTTCSLEDPRLTKAQVKLRMGLSTAAGVARRLKN